MTARRAGSSDEGSAPVEFALVAPLLLFVALAVLQLSLALYVRGVFVGAATEGARLAAAAGGSPRLGIERTERILAASIGAVGVRSVDASIDRDGPVGVVAVSVTADLPLVGVFGPTPMTVRGRAVLESADEVVPGFRAFE